MLQRIYVAGPMSKGDLMDNLRRAIDVAQILRNNGLYPYVPHLQILWHLIHFRSYEDWLVQDLVWLGCCDALIRLPGDSPGADREMAEARRLGLPVFLSVEELLGFIQRAA